MANKICFRYSENDSAKEILVELPVRYNVELSKGGIKRLVIDKKYSSPSSLKELFNKISLLEGYEVEFVVDNNVLYTFNVSGEYYISYSISEKFIDEAKEMVESFGVRYDWY